jgi:hypothetical protein
MGVHCMTDQGMVINHLLRQGKIKSDDPYLQGCGLRMKVEVPCEFPDDMPDDVDPLEYIRKLTLEEAIRRWNQRVAQ